jgi:hypothetical protein
MSISTIAAAAALAVAAVAPTAATDPIDHSHDAPAAEPSVAAERISKDVELPPYGLSLLGSYPPPETSCPAEAPFLDGKDFHTDKAWSIPSGVELKHLHGALVVTTFPKLTEHKVDGQTKYLATGLQGGGVITNMRFDWPWADNNWVKVVLHCNSWIED